MTLPSAADALALSHIALDVARRGGEIAMVGHRQPKRIDLKGETDLVTEFDRASEAEIRALLSRATPSIPVIGEEAGGEEAGGADGAELTWWVDPIDGTTNFAHGHPFWCVSVGAMAADGTCVAGAVVAPALGSFWSGAIGSPSVRDGAPCRVSEVTALDASLLATGFPYDRRTSAENNYAEFAALTNASQGVRRCGAAALDLCLVADGTYDGYWEQKLKAWDVAAGVCVVLGAGGRVSDYDGSPADPRQGRLVASNALVHDALLAALASVRGARAAT